VTPSASVSPSDQPSVSNQPSVWSNTGFENGLQGWTVSTLLTDYFGDPDGSVQTICEDTDDDFLQNPAGAAPEGNCYAKLEGSQSITRDFPLEGPGCVSFYYAWNAQEDDDYYNDFMRVSYVNDASGVSTTLVALDSTTSGDTSSWQNVAYYIPDAAIGSVLKFEGLVQNVGDTILDSFLYLDDVLVTEDCPSGAPSISQAPSLSPSLSLNPTMTIQKSDSIGSNNNDSGQTFFVKLFQGALNSSAPTVLRIGKYIDFRGDLNSSFEFVRVKFPDNCSDIQQKLINVADGPFNNSINDWVINVVPDNWAVVDVADCLVEDTADSGNWGLNIVVDPSNTVNAGYYNGMTWAIRFNIVLNVEN